MRKLRVHPIDLLVGTFVLYQLLVTNGLTGIAICDSIAWGLVYFAIRCIQHRYAWTKRWFIGVIISYGIIQSFLAFLQIAGAIPTNHALFAVTGSFANPGPLGGCLAICLIITFSIWKNNYNARIGWLLLCSTLFMGIACIMTDSRAAWLAVFVGICWIQFKHATQRMQKTMLGIIPILLVGTILLLYVYRPHSANGRLLIWKISTNIIADSPILGHGTASFPKEYLNYQAEYFKNETYTQGEALLASDNTYAFNEGIRIMCEYGAIGLLLSLGICYSLFLLSKKARGAQQAIIAALITYAVFSCFSYPTEVFPLKMIGSILLGLSVPNISGQLFRSKWMQLMLGVILLFVATVTVKGTFEQYRIKEVLAKYNIEENHDYVEYLTSNRCKYENNERILSLYAKILFDKGLYQECKPLLKKSIELLPTGEKYIDLGTINLYDGNIQEALTVFQEAAYRLPGHITPVYNLFTIYKGDNDTSDLATHYANKLVNMQVKKETRHTQNIRKEAALYLQEHTQNH